MAKLSEQAIEAMILYDMIVSKIPEIDRKGPNLPYTSINGNMYNMMRHDGTLGIRLSKEDRESFILKYNTVPFENYGSKIKEYVEVPPSLLKETDIMIHYLKLSHKYAKTLKPKATKKPIKKKTLDSRGKKNHFIGETYKNGQEKAVLEDNQLTHYFVDGSIKSQGLLIQDKMNGRWLFNRKDGSLLEVGHYIEGVKQGEWIRYDSKGIIAYHVDFKEGKVIKHLL